jgi:hypothetical protein
VTVEIGGIPVRFRTADDDFLSLLRAYYGAFVTASCSGQPFDVSLQATGSHSGDPEDVAFRRDGGRVHFGRRGLSADCDLETCCGHADVVEPDTYFSDLLLRMLYTLLLAPQGGFQIHAASHVRNGRAVLFAGLSGSGKTTISRLAPPDTRLLSDEVSVVRRHEGCYHAFGTPYVSSFGRPGENISAPVAALYLLAHGPENRCERLTGGTAAQALLRNVVFFARDVDLVGPVFQAAYDFLVGIPVYRLTFYPDARVWELIA